MCINIKTEKDMDNRIKALIGTLNILSFFSNIERYFFNDESVM